MSENHHEVVIIGAGVAGIYQLHHLLELDVDVTVIEADSDLGGTWFRNRYPGCRFDSESYTYGYSFSKELLQEWDWKERFSPQPENLRYLNHVADKFNLRPHMQFNCRVDAASFDDDNDRWNLALSDGRALTCNFLVTGIGLLSAPTPPRFPGMDDFNGESFHTYFWPHEPVELAGKNVAVIGTGATAVQLIGAIAGEVGDLTVFQRRPNWCAPLNNSEISAEEMADIKTRYDEIFDACAQTPGGFMHGPDRRGFYNFTHEERVEIWDRLYDEPGFAIWLQNFSETFMDEEANAELSEYIAERIRRRVDDPAVAEKLIPTDHGFGYQRVPMETGYYEAYNRDNVHLVDVAENPIVKITPKGVRTTEQDYDFDIIVYATGFDALTGAFDRMDIRGTDGQKLADKWAGSPSTFLGLMVHGFPNMMMIAGPQSGSASTNNPRGIETAGDWVMTLLQHMWASGQTRVEPTAEAEAEWTQHVSDMYASMLMRKGQGWFTGYNSNVEGRNDGRIRHLVYNGGAVKYRRMINECADNDYEGLQIT